MHAASPRCPIDQECCCFDCQAKNDRLSVEVSTFYRVELVNPSVKDWKTTSPCA